jgi:hypothetical protein
MACNCISCPSCDVFPRTMPCCLKHCWKVAFAILICQVLAVHPFYFTRTQGGTSVPSLWEEDTEMVSGVQKAFSCPCDRKEEEATRS